MIRRSSEEFLKKESESNIKLENSVWGKRVKEIQSKSIPSFQNALGASMIKMFLKAYKMDEFLKLSIGDQKPLPTTQINKQARNITTENTSISSLLLDDNSRPYSTISNYHYAYINKITTPEDLIGNLFDILDSPDVKNLGVVAANHVASRLKESEDSTARYQANQPLSIIDGVPFFVSEQFHLTSMKTVYGSKRYSYVSSFTSEAVETLMQLGAICCGYTSTSQFSINQFGINPNSGKKSSANPFNPRFHASGGTHGAASIVAAGIVPFTLGIDRFGSVRISSGSCGMVGFLPTYFKNKNTKKTDTDISSFCQVGSITNCVRDAMILNYFLSEGENSVGNTKEVPAIRNIPDLNLKSFKGIRFGVYPEYICNAEEEFRAEYLNVLDKIYENSGDVINIVIPELSECMSASFLGEAKTAYKSEVSKFDDTIEETKDAYSNFIMSLGKSITEENMSIINLQRLRSIKIMKDIFQNVDFIILLNNVVTPKKIKKQDEKCGSIDDYLIMAAYFFQIIPSLTGCPTITFNVNYNKLDNLPISVQLIGPWGEEAYLGETAHLLESFYPSVYRPEIFSCPFDNIQL